MNAATKMHYVRLWMYLLPSIRSSALMRTTNRPHFATGDKPIYTEHCLVTKWFSDRVGEP